MDFLTDIDRYFDSLRLGLSSSVNILQIADVALPIVFLLFLGLKVTQQSWLLLFAFSPPLFFRFSCLIFFLLLGI